jgi:ABC-type thiamine transport system substrate-binding protein
MRALVFSAMIFLAGCATQERIVTKEVMVPVYVKAPAPDWLMAGYRPDSVPVFSEPGKDPNASSCIAPTDEKALRLLIIDMKGRDEAWRAWAAP